MGTRQEADLAWELIDATKPDLNIHERNSIFVAVGSGDTFVAICHLLKWIAAKRVPLQQHQVQLCAAWLRGYVLHEDHEYLCNLVTGICISSTIQRSAPQGHKRSIKLPKRSEPLAGKQLIAPASAAS